jgi:hypothetical protein
MRIWVVYEIFYLTPPTCTDTCLDILTPILGLWITLMWTVFVTLVRRLENQPGCWAEKRASPIWIWVLFETSCWHHLTLTLEGLPPVPVQLSRYVWCTTYVGQARRTWEVRTSNLLIVNPETEDGRRQYGNGMKVAYSTIPGSLRCMNNSAWRHEICA